uniref:Uncharacterized protein n=1 Tax=Kalanchoe fedtschenkoi TaxID=63787 RepID=A0A7N0UC59_KALFE
MAAALFTKNPAGPYAYTKMDAEDPEELVHRRAQFLIYKAMQQIENRRRPSQIRVRISKLKIKIGRRLTKLRRSLMISVGAARACAARQLKRLVCSKDSSLGLPRGLGIV